MDTFSDVIFGSSGLVSEFKAYSSFFGLGLLIPLERNSETFFFFFRKKKIFFENFDNSKKWSKTLSRSENEGLKPEKSLPWRTQLHKSVYFKNKNSGAFRSVTVTNLHKIFLKILILRENKLIPFGDWLPN
jgi:hypothetical protein